MTRREELISIYRRGGEIVKYLLTENDLSIQLSSSFIKGTNASVADVKIPNLEGEYVAKIFTNVSVDIDSNDKRRTVKQLLEYYTDKYDQDVFIRMNGALDSKPKTVYRPEFALPCKHNIIFTYKSNISGKQCSIMPPFYMSYNDQYIEYMISILVGSLSSTGQCINFLLTVDFVTRYGAKTEAPNQIILMEKADDSLADQADNHDILSDDDMVDSLMIQCLAAICIYQEKYKMCHGDLHSSNIFLQTTEGRMWNGRPLSATNFLYSIEDVDLYVPNKGFIVKLADWGEATKWTAPVIASEYSIRNSSLVPNIYAPSYDILMVAMVMLYHKASYESLAGLVFEKITGEPAKSYLTFGGGCNDEEDRSFRPRLKKLKGVHVTAKDILNDSDLMDRFTTKPPGSVVRLGSL